MKAKYYIPTINELYIGGTVCILDRETLRRNKKEIFIENIITEQLIIDILKHNDISALLETTFRIRYLDILDIEQCVKEINPHFQYIRFDAYYISWELSEWKHIWISINNPTEIWITHINANNGNRSNVPFIIKNKSELKKLLKQLKIE